MYTGLIENYIRNLVFDNAPIHVNNGRQWQGCTIGSRQWQQWPMPSLHKGVRRRGGGEEPWLICLINISMAGWVFQHSLFWLTAFKAAVGSRRQGLLPLAGAKWWGRRVVHQAGITLIVMELAKTRTQHYVAASLVLDLSWFTGMTYTDFKLSSGLTCSGLIMT